ncbi:hypothetical protein N7454_006578 [Penicillium verhagenii]|nr:hypothetical protein N7454_006578 [Penicillium verhagenii]
MAPITFRRTTPPPETTYTQISTEEDVEAIGSHCQLEYCGQLDFLPCRCLSCKGTFCAQHRSEAAHKCPRAGEWARRRNGNTNNQERASPPTEKPTIHNTDQCYHVSCKLLIDTAGAPAVRCQNCNHKYCVKHRLPEGHDCAKITPLGARQTNGQTANETIKSMFSRVRTWGKDTQAAGANLVPKPKLKPGSAAARAVGVNTMKRTAKGQANVPVDKRLYLHTVGTADTQAAQPPSGDFYLDSSWKVGRVLDDVAKRLHVQNLNNRVGGEEAKLRIFHVESGEFLEFSDSIGAKVKQGDTIVLLRGAGAILEKS